ncbi:MAG: hypothetical protein Crog4KO_22970 [Crocinitomicaceae bacterium]
MSALKYILTADDYGPVRFINEGILHHVRKGSINSVQILPNFNQNLLNRSVDQLWNHVPPGKTVDVGLHLTLASGKPLITSRGNMDIYEIWGDFVDKTKYFNRNGKKVREVVFSKYKDFYLEYELLERERREVIETTIIQEFQAQKKQLEIALEKAKANNPAKPHALKLTCVSNHYDFFTLSQRFLELYMDVADGLAIRPPRRVPLWKSTNYVTSLGVFGVGTKKQRALAKKNIRLMDKYNYSADLKIKTPAYLDIGLYAALGGISETPAFSGFESRFKKLQEVFERANNQKTWKDYPEENKIIEIVFHLGKTAIQNPNFSQRDEEGYVGINYKYFENRLIENRVLNAFREEDLLDPALENLASWEECPEILFKKA